MFSVDLNTREGDGHVIVALRGELDVADAASVAAALAAAAARHVEIIVDLAGLDFIDSSGVAALARGRMHARHAGGDLVLAAPGQQVLRVLTLTRLIEVFLVHASVDAAAPAVPSGQPRQWRTVQSCSPRPDPGWSSMATATDGSYREEHQAADEAAQDRSYSLIRPLRIGFRRIWRVSRFVAMTRGARRPA
jgi:anti-sigma B factor antagonist